MFMHGLNAIFKRELLSYFATPLAYVFLAIFIFASGAFTFYIGAFFERGQANLSSFFTWHPWLFLFLIPAVSMRLWAEENKTGTIELMLTLPVKQWHMVAGKFLAAWLFASVAVIMCTVPMWITVSYLGDPDHGVIAASMLGSMLMAGGYLAIGACISSLTNNQVIAFVVSITVCFLFTLSGFPLVLNFFNSFLPSIATDIIANLSFLRHFSSITKGVVEISSLIYFLTFITLWLSINTYVLSSRRA